MPTSASTLLKTTELVKRFGGLLATDHVSLDVKAGEVHAIIGPNGAGKTTLIGQLTGELISDSGRIEIFDGTAMRDATKLPVAARTKLGLGRSYQITQICHDFTALQNVMLATQICQGSAFQFWRNVANDERVTAPAHAALQRVGLGDKAHTVVADMAHGEHRQLELAMTLALQPRLLLLDEPMAGMSHAESQDLVKLIQWLKSPEGGGHGILLIEHDMDAVFALADRLSVLVYGRVIATGTVEEIKNDPRVKEAYLGSEESQNGGATA